jgi:hypothetical protein
VKSFLDKTTNFTPKHSKLSSLHLSSIYWSKKMKEIQIHPAPQPGQPDCCTCTYFREMPEEEKVCCKENSERCHSRMPVNK